MICRNSLVSRKELALGISLNAYLHHVGFKPFPWQEAVAKSGKKRVILNCGRQSGKSTFVSSKPCHTARFYPGSLSSVIAPTEDQANEDMMKIKDFIAHDPDYPELVRDGGGLLELSNRSRIKIVIATDKAARGYSKPKCIMMDEASRIPDVVYKSGVRPMLTGNPDCDLYLLSTPYGQEGFFYNAWISEAGIWDKYEVRSPWDADIENPDRLVPAMPEEEFREDRATKGIHGFYSPRHADYQEQNENLQEMGVREYRQEYCCEFVETNAAVFSYQDLHRLFDNKVKPMVQHEGISSTSGALQPRRIGGTFF